MHKPLSRALRAFSFVAGLLPLAASAQIVQTQVQALTTRVTYSSTAPGGAQLHTWFGYQFTVSTGVAGHVVLKGSIAATDSAEPVLLDTDSSPPFCSATPAGAGATAIECVVGALPKNGGTTFTLYFKAPYKVAGNGVGDAAGTDLVRLGGRTVVSGNFNTPIEFAWTAPAPVELGTPVSTVVEAVLPKPGTLYTGNNALTSFQDRFGTKVVVPDAGQTVYAAIVESEASACGSFVGGRCFEMLLRLEDALHQPIQFPTPLQITLNIDQSMVVRGQKIANVLVFYEGAQVGLCASPTTPNPDGSPCIASVWQRTGNGVPGTVGMTWNILAGHNGSYKVF